MRVWVGDQEVTYPARFFFCDPLAQHFPNPHGAESSAWLKDGEINEEWGDDGTLNKPDRGINPGYPGVCSVGDPQWFIDGRLPSDVLSGPLPDVPPCCGYLPPPNPDPRCPPVPGVPAYFCNNGYAPLNFRIQATLGTGLWAPCNGTFSLAWVIADVWEVALVPTGYWALFGAGGSPVLETSSISGFFGVWRYFLLPRFDCNNPSILLPQPPFQPGRGNPPQVLLLPNS